MKSNPPALHEIIRLLEADNERLRRLNLEKDKGRFEIIFEQSALGNKIIDSSLKIIKVNRALVALLGYSKAELMGTTILTYAHPDHIDGWRKMQKELWTRKKPSFSIDTCLMKKNGTTIWCHVTSITFPENSDTLGYTIIEDISERMELMRLKQEAKELQFKIEKNEIERISNKISAAQILETQENERTRIAECLHNSIGQMLFGIKLSLDRVKLRTNSETENLKFLENSKFLLDETIRESRRISHELTPGILTDYGLKLALEEICKQYLGAISIKCKITDIADDLDTVLATTVYRIAQELILNIIKHSKASVAVISLTRNSSSIKLSVEDNGSGFDPAHSCAGIGLRTIQSKVQLLHGKIEVVSKKNQGSKITVTLPISRLHIVR